MLRFVGGNVFLIKGVLDELKSIHYQNSCIGLQARLDVSDSELFS